MKITQEKAQNAFKELKIIKERMETKWIYKYSLTDGKMRTGSKLLEDILFLTSEGYIDNVELVEIDE